MALAISSARPGPSLGVLIGGELILPRNKCRCFGSRIASSRCGGTVRLKLGFTRREVQVYRKGASDHGTVLTHVSENGLGSSHSQLDFVIAQQLNFLVAGWVQKLKLLGVLTALGCVIAVKSAAAATGLPVDEKSKRGLEFPRVTSSAGIVTSSGVYDESEGVDEAVMPQDEVRSHNSTLMEGSPVAAEVNRAEEAEEENDWKSTAYALTVPLKLVALRASVPPVWLKDFGTSQGKRAKVAAEFRGTLENIYQELVSVKSGKNPLTSKSALAADLVSIGDSWLGLAISRGLLCPIRSAEKFDWFHRLGTKWQTYLRRNQAGYIDPEGLLYAVPYRWGKLVIAYNEKKFKQHGISPIEDWSDLWRPELAGRISMISSPREVIGAVLKSLGASYNVRDFESDVVGGKQVVKERFEQLQQQVRVFDSVQYLKILGAGDTWVAVGWSGDVIPFAKRTSNIRVITPRSGTSLWADLWAVPATPPSSTKVDGRVRGPSPLILQWIDFCLQWARAHSFKGDVFVGASPLQGFEPPARGVSELQISGDRDVNAAGVVADVGYSNESDRSSQPGQVSLDEFLEPLSAEALEDFRWLLSSCSPATRFATKSFSTKPR